MAPAHFCRRIQGLPLSIAPGALIQLGSLCPLSIIESIAGMALNTNGDVAMQQVNFLARGVYPEKLDAAIAQLEAEPAGVGLDPAAAYEGISHAASAVLAAVARVAQRVRDGFPLNPAYILTPADLYDHEPMVPATPAELLSLSRPPNGLCFVHLEGDGHFLVHYGTLAFAMYGRCLAASRDAPNTPTRRFLADLHGFCVSAGLARASQRSAPAAVAQPAAAVPAAAVPPAVPPAGAAGRGRGRGAAPAPVPIGVPVAPAAFMEDLVSPASLQSWLEATSPPSFLAFRSIVGFGADAREQSVRDLHILRFGSEDQKVVMVASLSCKAPIRVRLPNLFAILPAAGPPGAVASYLGRLCRAANLPGLKSISDVSSLLALDGALKDAALSLTAPHLVVATVDDRLARVEDFFGANPSRPGAAGGSSASSRSAYASDLAVLLSQQPWRATEASILAELAGQQRALVLHEAIITSPVLGARQLALGRPKNKELEWLLQASKPLKRAIDILDNGSARHKLVADAFVADRLPRAGALPTLMPTTDAEIGFHTKMPKELSAKILRGAFDEIDWVDFLRLLLAVQKPNQHIAAYSEAWYDVHFVSLLTPHLERMSALLGLPSLLLPGTIPVPTPPSFGTLSVIATTISRQHAEIVGVPNAFSSENLVSLGKFASQVFPEAARSFHSYYSFADPAGPLPGSLFESPSAALAILNTLQKSMTSQEVMAVEQRAFYSIAADVAKYGSLDALVRHISGSRRASSPSPGRSDSDPPKKPTKGGKDRAEKDRVKNPRGDKSPSKERDGERSRSRSPTNRSGSPGAIGSRKDCVQYSADGTGFWYQDSQTGQKASPVYTFADLERMAGKSRQELDFPVILSNKHTAQARATLCNFEGMPGHEHATSSAHVAPFADFVEKVRSHFGRPASSGASTSAKSRP